jgi:hypothetical protein
MNEISSPDLGTQSFQKILELNKSVQTTPTKFNVNKFIMSPLGISLIAFIIFCVTLSILQPMYILKEDEKTKKQSVNILKVLVISFVCALLIYIIPIIIIKSCKQS